MKFRAREEVPHWLLLVAMVVASLVMNNLLPDRVPTHYNMLGEVDGWGSKYILLLMMPGIALALYLFMRLIPLLDTNLRQQQTVSKSYNIVRFVVLVLFAGIHFVVLLKAYGVQIEMRYLLTPMFSILFIALGWVMPSLPRNGMMGIRTPQTLENEEVWKKVHRAARPVMIVGGLLYLPVGLISEMTSFAGIMALAIGLLIWSITYSRRVAISLSDK